MKHASEQCQTTNSSKASSVYRIAVASALLGASIYAQAGATACNHQAQALEKCPQLAIPESAPTSALPRATATPVTHPAHTAGKHGIIFVGGRAGQQDDKHTINSQPVPPGRALRRRPPHGTPVEDDGH